MGLPDLRVSQIRDETGVRRYLGRHSTITVHKYRWSHNEARRVLRKMEKEGELVWLQGQTRDTMRYKFNKNKES